MRPLLCRMILPRCRFPRKTLPPMPPDYMGDAVTITMDAVAAATAPEITEEMYEQLDYLEKHPEENYYENEENFSQYGQGD